MVTWSAPTHGQSRASVKVFAQALPPAPDILRPPPTRPATAPIRPNAPPTWPIVQPSRPNLNAPPTPRPGSVPPGSIFDGLDIRSPPQQVSLDALEFAKRPAKPGSAGRPITVLTNIFELQLGPQVLHQYSVEVVRAARGVKATPTLGSVLPSSGPQPAAPVAAGGGKPAPTERHAAQAVAEQAVRALATLGKWQERYVFDGSSRLFSVDSNLPGESSVEVQEPPALTGKQARNLTYTVRLKRVATLDIKEVLAQHQQPSGGAIDVAVAKAALELVTKAVSAADPLSMRSGSGYVTYPKAPLRTTPSRFPAILPAWLKTLPGFTSTVRFMQSGRVGVAVDHKVIAVLEDGPLQDVLVKMLGARDMADAHQRLRKKQGTAAVDLSGVQVKLEHTGFKATLDSLGTQSASGLMFDWVAVVGQKPQRISVEQFFKQRYNVKLQYPDLPCVLTKKGEAYPIELCSVVKSQRRAQLKDAKQQALLVRGIAAEAVLDPASRIRRIAALMADTLGNVKGGVAKSFGVGLLKQDPLQAPARLIPGPSLSYSTNPIAAGVPTLQAGEWRPRPPVRQPGVWRSGVILVTLPRTKENELGVSGFWQVLQVRLKAAGCEAPRSLQVVWQQFDSAAAGGGGVEAALKAAHSSCRVPAELMLVILQDGSGSYDDVKRFADGQLGCATSCIDARKAGITFSQRDEKAARRQAQYCDQFTLKINTKLGGQTNAIHGPSSAWAPVLDGQRFMVMGVDVSRSGGGAGGKGPSLTYAAVIGTHDASGVSAVSPQLIVQAGSSSDIVYAMEDATKGLLNEYRTRNHGLLPEVLVVYRDGVSESAYDEILAVEFVGIKKACSSLLGAPAGYNPRVVFVVVSKSHNVRFFPLPGDPSRSPVHKSGNILPGTVVDKMVCDPHMYDFFLNSHAGILGTNRAPKYTVLIDEVGFSPDSIQLFTHWMCHTYALTPRSISVPPVVRYADKAATRGTQIGTVVGQRLLAKSKLTGKTEVQLLVLAGHQGNQSMSYV